MKQVAVIQHVAFEDLGTFEKVLLNRGYQIQVFDASNADWNFIENSSYDLLISLGGPLSVNDGALFPFLFRERNLIQRRIDRNLPTLGICLGAQLIAQALGGSVTPGLRPEIGWGRLELSENGQNSPLRAFQGVEVCHWHGEICRLPPSIIPLASTPLCKFQAFTAGKAMGLQFHPEATAKGLERWYIGHIHELSTLKISIPNLRAEANSLGENLSKACTQFFEEWLSEVETPQY